MLKIPRIRNWSSLYHKATRLWICLNILKYFLKFNKGFGCFSFFLNLKMWLQMAHFTTTISPETFLTSCQCSHPVRLWVSTGQARSFPAAFVCCWKAKGVVHPERNPKTNLSESTTSQISSINNSDSLILERRTLSSKYFLTICAKLLVNCWEEKTVLFEMVVKTSDWKCHFDWWFLKMKSWINIKPPKKGICLDKTADASKRSTQTENNFTTRLGNSFFNYLIPYFFILFFYFSMYCCRFKPDLKDHRDSWYNTMTSWCLKQFCNMYLHLQP